MSRPPPARGRPIRGPPGCVPRLQSRRLRRGGREEREERDRGALWLERGTATGAAFVTKPRPFSPVTTPGRPKSGLFDLLPVKKSGSGRTLVQNSQLYPLQDSIIVIDVVVVVILATEEAEEEADIFRTNSGPLVKFSTTMSGSGLTKSSPVQKIRRYPPSGLPSTPDGARAGPKAWSRPVHQWPKPGRR